MSRHHSASPAGPFSADIVAKVTAEKLALPPSAGVKAKLLSLGDGPVLSRWHLRARRNKRSIGRHLTAAGCGSLAWEDGGVPSRSAIGGQEHLVLSALHAAIRSVAVRSNDANAERRAGRTGIAFRTRGAGRTRITLGPLTLTATQHCAGQRHRDEHSQHIHGLPSEEGATGCPISCSRKRPTERASRQNAVGDSGAVSYK